MKVQKGLLPDSRQQSWMVLGDDYLPVEPIGKYLHYLDSLERSPNTISTYAHNLKLYWEFLEDIKLDWREITLETLSEFIHWLRNPNKGVISLKSQISKRSEKTINLCLTTVCGFYEFHEHLGTFEGVGAYRYQLQPGRKYKSFLHQLSKGKEVKTRLLKVKEPLTTAIRLASDEVVLDAIEAYEEALATGKVERPGAWLKKAIQEQWKPNEAVQAQSEPEKFNEWFPLAQKKGLVLASHRGKNGIEVYTSKEQWIPFTEMLNQHPLPTL